jgi:methylated-DNA-protein-cysteine methyltransferase-like protein
VRVRRGAAGGAAPPAVPTRAERRRRILEIVAALPRGRVASYGQVAALAGLPRHAREVGRVLSELPDGSRLPWQRVIAADGRVSARGVWGDEERQRRLLEAEGVDFDARGRVDLDRFRWDPDRAPAPRSRRGR